MKIIITGLNGTVAPAVAQQLQSRGHEVVGWNRADISPDDPEQVKQFLEKVQPAAVLHCATGSPVWAEMLAHWCGANGVKFLFTSTVSVFSWAEPGPFGLEKRPDATDEYGRYKMECEERIQQSNPQAIIARLGWQIGEKAGSNNMVDFLSRASERGAIEASQKWQPSCAFLADTAAALVELLESHPAGMYHLEGNPGLSFYEIATRLKHKHHTDWHIVPTDQPVQDGRLAGETRLKVGQIIGRF